MNVFGKTLAVIVGLALVGALGFGAWLMYHSVVALFAGLDPQVATVTGIGCLAALAAAWWIAHGMQAATRQSKAMALREEKTAAYQLFLDYWKERLQAQPRSEVSGRLPLLERLLALYGDPAVIRAHTQLRNLERDARQAEARARFGEALVAIRKDLGADTPGETARELERLLLPEPA